MYVRAHSRLFLHEIVTPLRKVEPADGYRIHAFMCEYRKQLSCSISVLVHDPLPPSIMIAGNAQQGLGGYIANMRLKLKASSNVHLLFPPSRSAKVCFILTVQPLLQSVAFVSPLHHTSQR